MESTLHGRSLTGTCGGYMGKEVKEDFAIKLTDEYEIRKSKNGFTLEFTSSNVVRKRFKGEVKESRETCTKYYGALYQALQGFVKHYYERSNSVDDIVKRVEEAMSVINSSVEAINSADRALVEKYKIVKVSNN